MVPGLDVARSGAGLEEVRGGALDRGVEVAENLSAARPRRGTGWAERGLVGWHLLSLDAPTVAAVWTWFVARCAGVEVPVEVPAAMFVAVWLLYVADRLLDGRGEERSGELEARHRFHWAHRGRFGVAMGVGAGALVPLVMAMKREDGGAFWPFVGLGVALLAWFGVIHWVRPLRTLRGAKELAPGLFFGAAVFLPALVSAAWPRAWMGAAAVAFGLVCWLNCRMIYRWEHAGAGAWTRAMGAGLGLVCLGLAAMRLGTVGPGAMGPVLLSVGLAAVGLLGLDGVRERIGRTTLRAAADLVLLTPLVVMWVK